MLTFWSFVFAIGLTAVHLGSKYMSFLTFMPRSRILSVAGGISVAYVFVHILPELNKQQHELRESGAANSGGFLEHHVYLVAMIGLAAFYGLERLARLSEKKKRDGDDSPIFWIHILSFSLYNALIGYLLIRVEGNSLTGLFLYFLAVALHFVSNDHSLRQSHKDIYDRYGRWILSLAVLAGWGLGYVNKISDPKIAVLFALLAGALILNVLKEELPEDRQSNFWAFAAGMAGYTLLLLTI